MKNILVLLAKLNSGQYAVLRQLLFLFPIK